MYTHTTSEPQKLTYITGELAAFRAVTAKTTPLPLLAAAFTALAKLLATAHAKVVLYNVAQDFLYIYI